MTLCGKCMKPEGRCDCRPLAIPDSGKKNPPERVAGFALLRQLMSEGKIRFR